eukprot:6016812-Lingulodinium_polyedra.AAC.1
MGGGVWQRRRLLDAEGERVLRATPVLAQHVFLPVPCRGGPFVHTPRGHLDQALGGHRWPPA